MAWLSPPTWLENADDHNAVDYRTMLSSLVAGRSGVAASGHLLVAPRGTPNMSVDVAAGGVFIASTRSANQGTYHAYNDGTINVPLAAADPTNPRIDRLIVQVRDEAQDPALTQNDVTLTVVQGTPAASPSAPSVTVSDYAVLADIQVPAAATSIVSADITDQRGRAVGLGGLQVVTWATRPASPTAGQQIYEADTDRVLVYNGANWVRRGFIWDTSVGSTLSGGSTPDDEDKREAEPEIQAASIVGNTGAGGGFRVYFQTEFTRACFTVTATIGSGDLNAGLILTTKNHGLDGFDAVVRDHAGVVPAAQIVRINYLAFGW